MNNLEKLIELADKPLLTVGRTKVESYRDGIFTIKIGNVFKKTLDFNLTNNTVTFKKKTYELKDKNPRINVDGDYEIMLNVGGKDLIVYCVDKKYKTIADDMLKLFTEILNNGVKDLNNAVSTNEEVCIKNPLLWLDMTGFMSNNKFKVDFQNGTITLDFGLIKSDLLIFNIKERTITHKEKKYSFNDVISITKDKSYILFKFDDSKEIDLFFEINNKKVDSTKIEKFRDNILNCFKAIIMNDNFSIPKADDSLIYIDETLEDYQKWINSVDTIVSGAQFANSLFFMDSASTFIMKVGDLANGFSANGFLKSEVVENFKLLDILFYSRELKAALLVNKLSIENYWEYKRQLFKIVQKRFTSFEELGKKYLEERKEFFESNGENFEYPLNSGENNYEEEQQEKIELINMLQTNKLSVWNELNYNIEL